MAKNAPKNLVKAPALSLSSVDCVDTAMNSNGTAVVVTIKMLAGAPEERSAKVKEDGKEKTITWKVMGSLSFDQPIVVNGTECRLVAVKKFGRLSSIEIRPVSAAAEATEATAFAGW
jgi:hypothetical protein